MRTTACYFTCNSTSMSGRFCLAYALKWIMHGRNSVNVTPNAHVATERCSRHSFNRISTGLSVALSLPRALLTMVAAIAFAVTRPSDRWLDCTIRYDITIIIIIPGLKSVRALPAQVERVCGWRDTELFYLVGFLISIWDRCRGELPNAYRLPK